MFGGVAKDGKNRPVAAVIDRALAFDKAQRWADAKAMRPVILREQLLVKLRERRASVFSLDDEMYRNEVRREYRLRYEVPDGTEPPPHAEMEAALIADITVPPQRVEALAQQRVDAVLAVLREAGVAPERVTAAAPEDATATEVPEVAFELR